MIELLIIFLTSLTIVSGGKSEYTLTYHKITGVHQNSNYYYTAALEFQLGVFNMTGVTLDIIEDTEQPPTKGIYLGPTAYSSGKINIDIDNDDDYFETKLNNGNIYINGGRRAVCYGVYDILELWGMRWYSSWMIVAPHHSELTIPDNYENKHRASIYYRETYTSDSMFDDRLKAHLRNNAGDSGLPGNYGGGLGAMYGTHSMFGFDMKSHPMSKYPQCYALQPNKKDRYTAALCLSNQKTFDIVKERVLNDIKGIVDKGNKLPHYIELSQGDNGYFCHCDECMKKYNKSGSCCYMHIEFLNKMCSEIEKNFPGIDYKVRTFLLVDSIRYPEGITPNPHIYFRLCTIENDLGRPYVLPPENNKKYENQRFMKDVEKWSKMPNAKFTLYDYIGNFDTQGSFPHNLVISAAKNLKFLKKLLDLEGYLPEDPMYPKGSYHTDMAELKAYLLMRLAYNIDLDIDEIISDFCNGFYGKKAGPLISKLMHDAEIEATRGDGMIFYTTWGGIGSQIHEDYIRHALRVWDNAIRAAKEDGPIYESNCKMSSLTTRAAMLYFMQTSKCVPSWKWTDQSVVRKMDRDEGSAALLHKYINEGPRTVHSYFNKWKEASWFYGEIHKVAVQCSGGYKARYCGALGGVCGTFEFNLYNYLGNHFGIDFVDQKSGNTFTTTDRLNFTESKEGGTYVYTNTTKDKTITKKFTLGSDGLLFEGSINTKSQCRAVSQIELSIGDGTNIAYKYDGNNWTVKAVDKLAGFEFFGISKPKSVITIADPKTKKGVTIELKSEIEYSSFLCNVTSKTIRVNLVSKINGKETKYKLRAFIGDIPDPIERPNYFDSPKVIKRYFIDDAILSFGPDSDEPYSCPYCSSGSGVNKISGTLQFYMAKSWGHLGLVPYSLVNATMEVAFDNNDGTDTGNIMVGCGYLDATGHPKETYRYIYANKSPNREIIQRNILSNWNFSDSQSAFMQNHLKNKQKNKAIFDRLVVDVLEYGPDGEKFAWDDGDSVGGGGEMNNIEDELKVDPICKAEEGESGASDGTVKPTGLSDGAIAGIIITIVIVLCVALFGFWYFFVYRKRDSDNNDGNSENSDFNRDIKRATVV